MDGATSGGCSTSADTPESTPLPELPGWPLAQLPEHEHEWPQPVPPHPIVHVSRSEIENCPLCQCIAAPTDPCQETDLSAEHTNLNTIMHTRQTILATIAVFCEAKKFAAPTPVTVLKDHGFDSLDLVELDMHLEDCYGITIRDSDAESWTTVDSVIDTVVAAIQFPHNRVNAAIQDILTEFHAATANFPQWPTDPIHALAVVQEEVGEVQKEVLQLSYEPHKSDREKVRKEAIQMAAMSLRFLLSLDAYVYAPGAQHEQNQ